MKAALEELDTIREVAVTRQRNAFGYDWRVTFYSELGNIPSLYVNDAGLAGPFAKAEISNMFNGRLPTAFHSVFVPGGATTSTVITGLTQGQGYQVLVSPHNQRGYGYQLVAHPALVTPQKAPSAPFNASFYALSPSALKLAWATPLDLGGSPIQMYRVEWDIVATFQNIGVSGNVREMIVDILPLNATSTYCIDIAINPASASIARYARVYAYNGYAWSSVGYPTPRSTIAEIRAPGAPLHVIATPTSATGIQVTWSPPAADDCVYGGDGGSPVTQYVIEWDTRPDFASPAAQASTDSTVAPLVYQIGGRDVLTGVISTVLESNTLYYVRVTAFNGQGAGVAGNAASAVTTSDQLPSPPTAVTVTTAGVTSLGVVWDLPISDGGATIEKYRLEYGTTDNNFTYYQAVDLPIVHEVQSVVAQSNVAVEVQAIRALVQVTNERQTVRSQVNGTDEIQTVTTTCDDVTNEVQRITTSAVDINEVQTLEPVGTDVNEVQLIRTRTLDIPTVQVLDISTPRVKGQQVIGVIISGIDTTSCSNGVISSGSNQPCYAIEYAISGSFKLSFDPNACGTDPAVSDSNWCARSLDLLGKTGYACSGSSACVTTSLTIATCSSSSSCSDNSASIQSALAGLYGSDPTQLYMTDGTNSVTVAVNQRGPIGTALSTTGAYILSYTVTFDSTTLRGQLAPLTVSSSSLAYTGGTFNAHYPAIGPLYYVGNGGDLSTAGATAYQTVLGDQPSGYAELVYTCESTTWTPTSVTVYYPGNLVYVNQASGTTALAQYMYIRLQTTYHQVIGMASSDGSGLTKWQIYPSFKKTGQLTTSGSSYVITGGSDMQTAADYGYYYSDPTAANGVSTACSSSNQYSTLEIYPTAPALSVVNLLRGLTTVINQDSDSISVTRTPYAVDSGRVGYLWTITFVKQVTHTHARLTTP